MASARASSVALMWVCACAANELPASDEDSVGTTDADTSDSDTSTDSGTDSGTDTGTDTSTDGDWEAELAQVFVQDHVAQIILTPTPGDWQALLDEWDATQTKAWYPTAFEFDAELRDPVGFRLKGWSSLLYGTALGGGQPGASSDPGGKFPLTIDFDREGGTHFHLLDRLSLNNNWADLSYMRTRLASRLYESMGVPSSSTAYARVSVDGHDAGLYTLVQNIDKPFLKSRFGTLDGAADGNLYKVVFTQTDIGALTWQGDARADYIDTQGCKGGDLECGILLQTNEDDPALADYGDLIAMLDVLNHAPDSTFAADIQAVFDVDSFLRLAAVSVAISSFDNYFGMGHNYYLYRRPDTGVFMMLPWDLNETFAGHPCGGGDMVEYGVSDPVCNQRGHDFILSRRILAVPAFEQQYRDYLGELAEQWLTPALQQAWIDEFDGLIHDQIATDPNYIGELADYERSLGLELPSGENLGGHGGPEYNLMDFVTRRQQVILDQL